MLADHPHLHQLKNRPGVITRSGAVLAVLPWVLLTSCFVLMALLASPGMGYQLWMLVTAAAVIATVAVPFVGASSAATLTATDIESGHYALVAVTVISDRALVLGYFYAALYRMRGALWLMALLVATAAVGSVWMELQVQWRGDLLSIGLMWSILALQLGGLCLAVVALGVMLALRVSRTSALSIGMPLLALALTLGAQFLVARALMWPGHNEHLHLWYWLQFPLLIVLPYGVMFVSLHAATRWARRPFADTNR